jgi:hypothetical protein
MEPMWDTHTKPDHTSPEHIYGSDSDIKSWIKFAEISFSRPTIAEEVFESTLHVASR